MARRKRSAARRATATAREPHAGAPATAHARSRDELGPFAWPPRRALLVATAVALSSFALYYATAARDIVFGDTPELTAVAIVAGVAHPPGYPLWTMLAHGFTWLPLETPAFRVALFSVVCHALTVGVVVLTAYRISRSYPAAVVAGVALATAPLFWSWSLVAEVFPLNDLLAALMTLFLVIWHERPEDRRPFLAAALIGGLGMAHHQTIGLLAPAVLWLMWRHRRVFRRRPRTLVDAIMAFGIGLLPLLYLPWAASRDPLWNWGRISSIGDLVAHLARTSYGSGQLITEGFLRGGAPEQRALALLSSFNPVQGALVLIGAGWAWRRARDIFWFFVIGFAVAGLGFALYANANLALEITRAVLERFFLLPQVVVAPLAALGVVATTDALGRALQRLPRRRLEAALSLAAVASAVALVPLSYAAIDQRENRIARRLGEDILATLRPGQIFLAGGDAIVLSTAYLVTIEHARPDITFIALPLLRAEWYIRELKARYPDLDLRHPRYDRPPGTMKAFLDDNSERPISFMGDVLDNSTKQTHWFYRRGLVSDFKLQGQTIALATMDIEMNAEYTKYSPPRYEDVKGRLWEKTVLLDYAFPAYYVGKEYEINKLYAEARAWYERALAITPELLEAQDALARLPKD